MKKVEIDSFTKLWVDRLMWFACLWITWSYMLASFGYTEIAERLSLQAMVTVLATMIPYFAKSFFENKSKYKNGQPKKTEEPKQEITLIDLDKDETVG